MKNKLKIAQNSSHIICNHPLASGDAEGPQTPGRIVFGFSGLTCLDPEISPQKLAGMVMATVYAAGPASVSAQWYRFV